MLTLIWNGEHPRSHHELGEPFPVASRCLAHDQEAPVETGKNDIKVKWGFQQQVFKACYLLTAIHWNHGIAVSPKAIPDSEMEVHILSGSCRTLISHRTLKALVAP